MSTSRSGVRLGLESLRFGMIGLIAIYLSLLYYLYSTISTIYKSPRDQWREAERSQLVPLICPPDINSMYYDINSMHQLTYLHQLT